MTEKEIKIYPIPALEDNYIWAMVDESQQLAAIVDPGEAAPVIHFLEEHSLKLTAILITHHHWDHTHGLPELIETYHPTVFGPANPDIHGITHAVIEGSTIDLHPIPLQLTVLQIPGHTLDHVAYYAPGMLFCGDTLFSAGCGRAFEGTHQQLFASLQRLASLPDDTRVYCAHEYTINNLNFAKLVEPSNRHINDYLEKVTSIRISGEASLPSSLGLEKQVNPFLRCDSPEIINITQHYSNQRLPSPTEVFMALRKWKDHFRSG